MYFSLVCNGKGLQVLFLTVAAHGAVSRLVTEACPPEVKLCNVPRPREKHLYGTLLELVGGSGRGHGTNVGPCPLIIRAPWTRS